MLFFEVATFLRKIAASRDLMRRRLRVILIHRLHQGDAVDDTASDYRGEYIGGNRAGLRRLGGAVERAGSALQARTATAFIGGFHGRLSIISSTIAQTQTAQMQAEGFLSR